MSSILRDFMRKRWLVSAGSVAISMWEVHTLVKIIPYWESMASFTPYSHSLIQFPKCIWIRESQLVKQQSPQTTTTHPQVVRTWRPKLLLGFLGHGLSYPASWKIERVASVNSSCFPKNRHRKKICCFFTSIYEALATLGNRAMVSRFCFRNFLFSHTTTQVSMLSAAQKVSLPILEGSP